LLNGATSGGLLFYHMFTLLSLYGSPTTSFFRFLTNLTIDYGAFLATGSALALIVLAAKWHRRTVSGRSHLARHGALLLSFSLLRHRRSCRWPSGWVRWVAAIMSPAGPGGVALYQVGVGCGLLLQASEWRWKRNWPGARHRCQRLFGSPSPALRRCRYGCRSNSTS